MKNKFSVFFIFLIFITTILTLSGFTKSKVIAEETFKSKAVYLCDAESGTEMIKSNETKRYPIASMCKIMTLLVTFDEVDNKNLDLNENIIVSKNASGMGGSQVFLEENGVYKVSDLIKSITVASANDACVAIAERISGSEQNFVDKMNAKATEIGMENTYFVNCTGLPQSGQYSCAKDVALMFSKLLKHKEYFKFSNIWMDKIEHKNGRFTEISNTNKLIRYYDGCDAGKTGFTSEAGHCLCASAVRNNMRLISVVINSPDSKTRFKECSGLFNYGFDNYVSKTIIDKEKPLDLSVTVSNGKKDSLSIVAENSVNILSKRNEERSFEINFTPNSSIKAPVIKGDMVGILSIYENGIEIQSVNVLANEDILEKTYFDCLTDIFKNWALF